MTTRDEDELQDYLKYDQEWREIASSYQHTMRTKIVDFLLERPDVGSFFRMLLQNKPLTDYIMIQQLMDQLSEVTALVKETTKKQDFIKELDLPYLTKNKHLAEELIRYITQKNQMGLQTFQNKFMPPWQIEWFSSLGEVHRSIFDLRLESFPHNPIFLIGSYLGDFELIHQLLLEPYFESVISEEKNTYRERLEWLFECLEILHVPVDIKYEWIFVLESILDPKNRNSLVKHAYIFDIKKEEFRYFIPDPLAHRNKELGVIGFREFLHKIIKLKIVFWILLIEFGESDQSIRDFIQPFTLQYPHTNTIAETIFSPEAKNVLKQFVSNFKGITVCMNKVLENPLDTKIIRHQLLESWLSFRLVTLAYVKEDYVPDRKLLTNFQSNENEILVNMLFKDSYYLYYEEMLQTIVHPLAKILFKKQINELHYDNFVK